MSRTLYLGRLIWLYAEARDALDDALTLLEVADGTEYDTRGRLPDQWVGYAHHYGRTVYVVVAPNRMRPPVEIVQVDEPEPVDYSQLRTLVEHHSAADAVEMLRERQGGADRE